MSMRPQDRVWADALEGAATTTRAHIAKKSFPRWRIGSNGTREPESTTPVRRAGLLMISRHGSQVVDPSNRLHVDVHAAHGHHDRERGPARHLVVAGVRLHGAAVG